MMFILKFNHEVWLRFAMTLKHTCNFQCSHNGLVGIETTSKSSLKVQAALHRCEHGWGGTEISVR